VVLLNLWKRIMLYVSYSPTGNLNIVPDNFLSGQKTSAMIIAVTRMVSLLLHPKQDMTLVILVSDGQVDQGKKKQNGVTSNYTLFNTIFTKINQIFTFT
jgi:hypothetical protein